MEEREDVKVYVRACRLRPKKLERILLNGKGYGTSGGEESSLLKCRWSSPPKATREFN